MNRVQTIRVGDLDIEYELVDFTDPWRADPPETILLHHGYCRNMQFWRSWVPLLSRDYRVLRFSGRGCGATTVPPPTVPYTMAQLLADAIGLLDALDIGRVIWAGESSGGLLGLAAALSYKDRISALILCDTPFKIRTTVANAYNVGERDHASAIAKHGFEAWCRQTLGYRIDLSRASPALQDWYVREMGSAPSHIAVAHHQLAVDADIWPRIGEITVPALIMGGAGSQVTGGVHGANTPAPLRNAKVVAFEGFGHGIHLLAPERCVAEARAFLSQRDRAGPGKDPAMAGG